MLSMARLLGLRLADVAGTTLLGVLVLVFGEPESTGTKNLDREIGGRLTRVGDGIGAVFTVWIFPHVDRRIETRLAIMALRWSLGECDHSLILQNGYKLPVHSGTGLVNDQDFPGLN